MDLRHSHRHIGVPKASQTLLYGSLAALWVSMIVGIFIMLRLINRMIVPIRSLSEAVKSFSSENMTVRTKVDSDDELGELGRSFNRMADTIQDYSVSLERRVEREDAGPQGKKR